jgi:adenylate cyclase
MVPFLPVLQLLKSYFRLVEGDGADTARSKIAGTLALVDPQLVRAVPLLLEFMGVADPKSTPLQLDPDARRGQFLDLVHQMIRAESRHRPLVMLVEDLHWIDGGTETFLSVTAEAVAGVRALLLVNFRPEYHAPWMKRSYYQQLPLLPLGPEVTREFIRHLLGNEPSLERLGEFIQSRTGGNPFFIEEMVRVLAEEGKLDGTRGDYRLVEPIETLQLPASVRTILTARIDRLGENEKQVLQTAAVIGKEFSKPILSQVVEAGLKPTPTQEDVAEALGRLEDGEFIHQTSLYPTLGYAFVHPLTQEVAYASQLVERKKTIHTAVARALEVLEQDALEEKAALIAQHWESAGELSEAARWHQRAAAWLSTRSSAEALAHYRRVREILLSPKVPADHALVFEAASQILYLGSFEGLDSGEARSCFGWAKQSCEENGNRAGLAVLLARSAFFLGGIGEMGECLKYLAESISLADQTGYPFVQAGSRAGATYWFLQAGRLREALAAADEGLGILETIGGDPTSVLGDPVVVMQNFRGWTLRWMGRLEEAQRTLERTKERAETRGDLTMLEIAHAGLAQVGEALGRLDMLRFHARQCLDLGMQLKSPRMRNLGLLMWGRSLLLDGQAEEAVQQFEEVCSVLETRGVTREVEAVNLGALALAQARCGRIAEARDTARRAVEAGAHNGTLAFQAYALCEQAAVLLLDMDSSTKDVANALDMASELIEQTGSAFLMPYVHRLRAQLAERTGDGETWRRELERAVRLLREMGASAAAEDVAKELRLETRA